MDDILFGIAQLKQELDVINEDLEMHIRKTRDLESKVLIASEELKRFSDEEQSYQGSTILQESRLQSLTIVSEKIQAYLVQEEKNLQDAKNASEFTTSRIRKEREEFMLFCLLFQKQMEDTALERQSVLFSKKVVCEQNMKLNSVLDAAVSVRRSVMQEKTQYHEQLNCENNDLDGLLHDSIVKNDRILKDIDNHDRSWKELDIVNKQMSEEMQENEDAIQQLKDLVMGLQFQLSQLLDQS